MNFRHGNPNGPLTARQLVLILIVLGAIVLSALGISRANRENHQAEQRLQQVTCTAYGVCQP